jgi:adenylate kinase family enzyme
VKFRALTTTVEVEIDDDVELADLARALVSSYPGVEQAELRYHVERHTVRRGPTVLPVEDVIDTVPLFEMDLYEQVVARAHHGWVLHAAAIDVGGRALVLSGPSGAGKTTLTLALAKRGHRVLTEEVVLIQRTGVVFGLARPIHVPADSPQRHEIPSGWRQCAYPLRGRDGRERENIIAIAPRQALALEPLPLHAMVRIGHGQDWPVELRRSSHHVALQRLWDRALRQDDQGLETAAEVLRLHGSYELSSRTADEALTLLEPLLK